MYFLTSIVMGSVKFIVNCAGNHLSMLITMDLKPQFSVDDLYISPFTAERRFDPMTGAVLYVPIERNLHPTGIHLMDRYLQCLCTSKCYTLRSLQDFVGVRLADFSVMCRLLTGMHHEALHEVIRQRLADDLLRYTSLPLMDIAKRCGFGNYPAMCKFFQRRLKCTPGERQRQIRRKGDLGRLRL